MLIAEVSQGSPAEKAGLKQGDVIVEFNGKPVETLTSELAQQFGYQGETGVVITEVASGSVAESAGIRPGALIKEVNRRRVHNVAEFDQALARTGGKGTVLLLIKQGRGSRYVALSLEE